MAVNLRLFSSFGRRVPSSRLIDLTDQTFGQLVVIQRVDCLHNARLLGKMEELGLLRRFRNKDWRSIQPRVSPGDGARWLCLCDCGKFTVVISNALRSGNTRSCGCLPGKNRRLDLAGKTFGNRTVIGFDEEKGRWEIRCTNCGDVKFLLAQNVVRGRNCSRCSPGRVKRGKALQVERKEKEAKAAVAAAQAELDAARANLAEAEAKLEAAKPKPVGRPAATKPTKKQEQFIAAAQLYDHLKSKNPKASWGMVGQKISPEEYEVDPDGLADRLRLGAKEVRAKFPEFFSPTAATTLPNPIRG